jgi:hypothetical protein
MAGQVVILIYRVEMAASAVAAVVVVNRQAVEMVEGAYS